MTTTRARFYIESTRRMKWGTEVTLRAVSKGEHNKHWAAATPSGVLTMTISNELADRVFPGEAIDEGREFYLDLSEAEPEPE